MAGYLAIRNAVVLLTGRSMPEVAALFLPAAGDPLMRLHLPPRPSNPADIRRAIINGLPRAPLSEVPFLLAVEQARSKGDYDRAARLAQEATERQPRSVVPRGQALKSHLMQMRWPEAIEALRLLWWQEAETQSILVKVMALMARTDIRARSLLLRTFAEDDGWRASFLATAAQTNVNDAFIGALKSKVKQGDSYPAFNAYQQWIDSLPADQLRLVQAVFDGRFESEPDNGRYGWSLTADVGGWARIVRSAHDNALRMVITDKNDMTVATQDILLPPGPFRLQMAYSRTGKGTMTLSLTCAGGRALATLPLRSRAGTTIAKRIFTVPPRCPIQRLALTGSSGTASVRSIEIVPKL